MFKIKLTHKNQTTIVFYNALFFKLLFEFVKNMHMKNAVYTTHFQLTHAKAINIKQILNYSLQLQFRIQETYLHPNQTKYTKYLD